MLKHRQFFMTHPLYSFLKNFRRTFSHFLGKVIMLDASNFRALVGGTIQGFSKKNWISISFLSFENIRPRPSKLVYFEIHLRPGYSFYSQSCQESLLR